ncbi:hypothetical protein Q3G72_027863 [Acer saccharum]|nr:hypothetical protein Q3G72_027863 [Acer saccharum]
MDGDRSDHDQDQDSSSQDPNLRKQQPTTTPTDETLMGIDPTDQTVEVTSKAIRKSGQHCRGLLKTRLDMNREHRQNQEDLVAEPDRAGHRRERRYNNGRSQLSSAHDSDR